MEARGREKVLVCFPCVKSWSMKAQQRAKLYPTKTIVAHYEVSLLCNALMAPVVFYASGCYFHGRKAAEVFAAMAQSEQVVLNMLAFWNLARTGEV